MDIKNSIVAILDKKKKIIGTGFVAGENLILTCAHVVEKATSTVVDPTTDLNVQVTIRFAVDGSEVVAQVDMQNSSPGYEKDVALLRVDALPQGAKPLPLAPAAGSAGHDFYTYGYAIVTNVQGIGARGKIVDIVDNGRLVQLTSQEPDHGMSGGPVLDEQRRVVIGMVTKGKGLLEKDKNLRNTQTTFATTTDVIFEICLGLKPLRANIAFLFNVPSLPKNYIFRTKEIIRTKKAILAKQGKPLAVVGKYSKLGLQGMGGIGKSVLAAAIARDPDIRKAFPDGVIWLTLGQNPQLTIRQAQIAEALGEKNRAFQDVQQGRVTIERLFEEKSCLLILDDVWNISHVDAFDCLDENSSMLITTRNASLANAIDVEVCTLDVMSEKQSLELLARWSEQPEENLSNLAIEVASECGFLPLALAMAGALVQKNPENWERVLFRLQMADLESIRQQFPNYPYPNLLGSVQVSVDALPEKIRVRYLDFAVFPEDVPISIEVLFTFWLPEGLSQYDVKDILDIFIGCSLIQKDNRDHFTLHDIHYDYVRHQASDIKNLHHRLLNSYAFRGSSDWTATPNDGYFYQYLVYHLSQAGRIDELYSLLFNFDWLESKLNNSDVNSLIADFVIALQVFADDYQIQLLEKAISLSSYVLSKDKTQLASQLIGRMLNIQYPEIQALLKNAMGFDKTFWLRPLTPSLTTPYTFLLRTITGTNNWITELIHYSTNDFLLVSTLDEIWLWNLKTLESKCILAKSIGPIHDVVLLEPEKKILISGEGVAVGSDKLQYAIRILDIELAKEKIVARGQKIWICKTKNGSRVIELDQDGFIKIFDPLKKRSVQKLKKTISVEDASNSREIVASITPDEKFFVITSPNGEIYVKDLKNDLLLYTIAGHSRRIFALVFTSDSKVLISASADKMIKIWRIEDGEMLGELRGHSDQIIKIRISLSNRFLVSTSSDFTTRIWDLKEYREIITLTGRSQDMVFSSNEDNLITASENKTILVWDLKKILIETENKENMLLNTTEHNGWIWALASMPNGDALLSGALDKTLKIWDIKDVLQERSTKLQLLNELAIVQTVYDAEISPDSQFAVFASGQCIKVWNLFGSYDFRTFEDDSKLTGVIAKDFLTTTEAIAITPDSKFTFSGSRDGLIRKWNLETGQVEQFIGDKSVFGLFKAEEIVFAPSGKLIGGYADSVIRVWNINTGAKEAELLGHTGNFLNLAITRNGKTLFSVSSDGSIRSWNIETGYTALIGQHSGRVFSVAVSPDDKYIVTGSDDREIRLWEIATKTIIASFYTDAAVQSCVYHQNGKVLIAGDRLGHLHFLRIEKPI